MAAAGHYGHQSPLLIKHFAEDFGFRYLTASDKGGVEALAKDFVEATPDSQPMLFEVFTDSKCENEALHMLRNIKIDGTSLIESGIRNALGKTGVAMVKKIIGK